MKIQFKQLAPQPLELFSGLFLTFTVILLANSKRLLNYYGLEGSDQVINTNASNTLSEGLRAIDSFTATNGVVTFLIWAVVGVFCFGIVEALGNGYRELRLERQVSSARYVHPVAFTKTGFWRGVLLNSFSLIVGLLLLAATSLLLLIFIIPLGLAYSRVFLFNVSLTTAVDISIGVAIVFVGLLLLNVMIRFMLHRRQIISLN
ncbi:hypothetical protein H7097_03845 [Aeromicrobium sp.]|nr:hypothetical protein [Candidatus Saccharibacteria bacterium]